MRDDTQPHTWWRASALACALLAFSLPVVARLVAGPSGGDVHVEWRSSVDETARHQLEARFRLDKPRKLEDTYTWRYDLTDPSRDNIRALVNDPAVEDTHEIDRNEYTLAPTAPRTTRRQRFAAGGDTIVEVADGLAIVLLAFAALTCATRTSPWKLLQRGIPEVDASTAALFRIVFGSAVLVFFASHRVDASWLNATFDLKVEGRLHAAVLEWLRGHPAIVDLLTPWLLAMGVAFTAGIFTRFTYALFVAGVLIWAYVAMSLDSTHPHSTLVLALVALLPSRWGDALSVDAWLRRTRGRESAARPAGTQYGYSVWIPGLVLGAAFAAAAWAKLRVPPGWADWVLNGTVKYHFITDSVNAPVAWGLQLARHPLLAILASFGAVAIEALLITAVFTRNERYRVAMGAAALALLAGFNLFMGVFWPGWWILLLGFLPWRNLGRAGFITHAGRGFTPHQAGPQAGPPPRTPARWGAKGPPYGAETASDLSRPTPPSAAQLIVIVAVITQQVIFSNIQVERAPMFSNYPMYSTTYSSPATWNASRPPLYRIVVSTDRGSMEVPRCNPDAEFVREFQAALEGAAEATASVWRALRGCGEDLAGVRHVTLEGDRRTFDWNRLVFTSVPAAMVLGPLAAEEHAITPGTP